VAASRAAAVAVAAVPPEAVAAGATDPVPRLLFPYPRQRPASGAGGSAID
jgi:hypothetical protein